MMRMSLAMDTHARIWVGTYSLGSAARDRRHCHSPLPLIWAMLGQGRPRTIAAGKSPDAQPGTQLLSIVAGLFVGWGGDKGEWPIGDRTCTGDIPSCDDSLRFGDLLGCGDLASSGLSMGTGRRRPHGW